MMPAAWIRILAVAVLTVLALIGLVVHEQIARDAGTEIRMAMQPVDPQSLLSGAYVEVSPTESLPVGQPCPPGATEGPPPPTDLGQRPSHWLALARRGDTWSVAGVADTQAAAARFAPLTARGDAYCIALAPDTPGSVTADLGVDRVSLSQAEATHVSELVARPVAQGGGTVQALISIGADGQARMKGLVVNGQRMELTWY
jgi:hypothetical protein